jgi:hypothetical protein
MAAPGQPVRLTKGQWSKLIKSSAFEENSYISDDTGARCEWHKIELGCDGATYIYFREVA